MKAEEIHMTRLKDNVIKTYGYRTELHLHTSPVSACADFAPEEVVKTYADIGYDTIAVTNHFSYSYRFERFDKEPTAEEFVKWYMSDYYKAAEAGEALGINVILGAEIRFAENLNDYLIYGIDDNILKEVYERLPYGIDAFRSNSALKDVLVVQAHRFRNGIEYVDPSYIDGLETFNMHNGHNSANGKAVKFADENNIKIVTAGTDYHHKDGEGMAALRTKVRMTDSYELADVLRSGDYALEIGGCSVILP